LKLKCQNNNLKLTILISGVSLLFSGCANLELGNQKPNISKSQNIETKENYEVFMKESDVRLKKAIALIIQKIEKMESDIAKCNISTKSVTQTDTRKNGIDDINKSIASMVLEMSNLKKDVVSLNSQIKENKEKLQNLAKVEKTVQMEQNVKVESNTEADYVITEFLNETRVDK